MDMIYFAEGQGNLMRGHKMAQDKLLKLDEVAERLGVNIETVRRWVRNGEIEVIDLGGKAGYRVTEAALERFLRGRVKPVRDDD
jgi:excisionase family DNA binding protein